MNSTHPDPAFPRLHGRPSRGWVNDPNGCAFIDGRYHVFFQYNPDGPHHEQIKWGHVSSTDLVRWDHEPIALVNRPGELDQRGCWSGCVIDDDGPTAIYSAAADASDQTVVLLAHGDRRLQTWQQDREPVTGQPADAAVSHARDPFVFIAEGHRYAIQGAGHHTTPGAARVLVYSCDDLRSWTELGALITADDPVAAEVAPADIWECPNLLRFGEEWVLIVSQWIVDEGTIVLGGARYLTGELIVEQGNPRFSARTGGRLDTGPCFYAPQVLRQAHRALIWAWAWEHGRPQADIDRAGWAGTLTFCRELQLVDGLVVSRPATELAQLRGAPLNVTPGVPFRALAFDIELQGRAALWLVDDAEKRLVAQIDVASAPVTQPRILVDGSIVEVFDGSPTPFTTRAYPTSSSTWLLEVEPPADIAAWALELSPYPSRWRRGT